MISGNDWLRIEKALQKMEPLTLTRRMPEHDVSLTIEVAPAGKPWPVAMIIGVQYDGPGHRLARAWCQGIKEARETVTELCPIRAQRKEVE